MLELRLLGYAAILANFILILYVIVRVSLVGIRISYLEQQDKFNATGVACEMFSLMDLILPCFIMTVINLLLSILLLRG